MKVTTIDGGFRGLAGVIATDRRLALEETFARAVDPLYRTYDEVIAAGATGQLPSQTAHWLTERYGPLADRVESHLQRASTLDEADVVSWQREASAIERAVGSYVRDARSRLGYESSTRGLQIAFIAGTSIALLGGAAWLLVSLTRSPRRASRRRSRSRSRSRRRR